MNQVIALANEEPKEETTFINEYTVSYLPQQIKSEENSVLAQGGRRKYIEAITKAIIQDNVEIISTENIAGNYTLEQIKAYLFLTILQPEGEVNITPNITGLIYDPSFMTSFYPSL